MKQMAHRKPKPHRKHFLKEWREKLDITQERAMDRLGWSQSKISRIENFKIPLTLDDLHAASVAYGCSEWELMNVDPTKEREVVDMIPWLEKADPEMRKDVADYAAFIASRKQGS